LSARVYKSGAAKRRERRERENEEAKKAPPPAAVVEKWDALYGALGGPPEETVQRVEWANRVAAEMAWEQLTAPAMRSMQERRLILEAVRSIGMTAVKALYESRLKRIERKLFADMNGAKAENDGIEDL
jgi:hypothetical protein